MNSESQAFYDMLKRDLVTAMKARQSEAVAALRSVIAAIDNAQAVQGKDGVSAASGQPIATGGAGVGSTEAQRRQLSLDEIHKILQAEIADRSDEAERYTTYGEADAADTLHREADVLAVYLQK